MKNFPFIHEGKELWYSRSLACSIVVLRDNPMRGPEVLVCKRGKGVEFNKGKMNIPGGFIDFDENAKQAALRELFEETGVKIPEEQAMFLSLDTEPKGGRQTMVALHFALVDYETSRGWKLTNENSEPGEVEEILWVPLKNLNNFNWTRGQIENITKTANHVGWFFSEKYKDWFRDTSKYKQVY